MQHVSFSTLLSDITFVCVAWRTRVDMVMQEACMPFKLLGTGEVLNLEIVSSFARTFSINLCDA